MGGYVETENIRRRVRLGYKIGIAASAIPGAGSAYLALSGEPLYASVVALFTCISVYMTYKLKRLDVEISGNPVEK